MSESLFSKEDLNIFTAKGIEEAEVLRQLEMLRKGVVPLRVEVPLLTFNPVKRIEDLLREPHLASS